LSASRTASSSGLHDGGAGHLAELPGVVTAATNHIAVGGLTVGGGASSRGELHPEASAGALGVEHVEAGVLLEGLLGEEGAGASPSSQSTAPPGAPPPVPPPPRPRRAGGRAVGRSRGRRSRSRGSPCTRPARPSIATRRCSTTPLVGASPSAVPDHHLGCELNWSDTEHSTLCEGRGFYMRRGVATGVNICASRQCLSSTDVLTGPSYRERQGREGGGRRDYSCARVSWRWAQPRL
jgi:hypothetical protein